MECLGLDSELEDETAPHLGEEGRMRGKGEGERGTGEGEGVCRECGDKVSSLGEESSLCE